jgi:hypothetical protein
MSIVEHSQFIGWPFRSSPNTRTLSATLRLGSRRGVAPVLGAAMRILGREDISPAYAPSVMRNIRQRKMQKGFHAYPKYRLPEPRKWQESGEKAELL